MDIRQQWIPWTITMLHVFTLLGEVSSVAEPEPLTHVPDFRPTEKRFTYKVGETAVLKCEVEGLGTKTVIWRKAGEKSFLTAGYNRFSEDARLDIARDPARINWHLYIRNVQVDDAGVYECQVSSKRKDLRHHVTLRVIEPITEPPVPAEDIQIFGAKFVDEGDPISLRCRATSANTPLTDIDWFRNGNKLQTNLKKGVMISKKNSLQSGSYIESYLDIRHSRLEHRGNYVCRTNNKTVKDKLVVVLKANTTNKKRGTKPNESDASYSTGNKDEDKNAGNSIHLRWSTSLPTTSICISLVFYVMLNNSDLT